MSFQEIDDYSDKNFTHPFSKLKLFTSYDILIISKFLMSLEHLRSPNEGYSQILCGMPRNVE